SAFALYHQISDINWDLKRTRTRLVGSYDTTEDNLEIKEPIPRPGDTAAEYALCQRLWDPVRHYQE
ncbi:hypothetical protein KIPB_005360, partial [Kipferlia bialata]